MADWFKFYENDLDETRLQYAIHQMSEVCPVWVGILSECCRHKSDTIRWGSNEIELFGFSHRLNISIPKVNEAINLLCTIDYISKGENTLKVLKWKDKQSEYCQKKAQKQSKCPDSVGTVSGQCPPRGEERRGEEIRTPIVPKGDNGVPILTQSGGRTEIGLPLQMDSESAEDRVEHAFETFWRAYPRRVSKKHARKSFQKAGCYKFLDALLLSIEKHKKCEQWTKDHGQFIPYPASWINSEGWLNEVKSKPASTCF